jgi:hypothetical protein
VGRNKDSEKLENRGKNKWYFKKAVLSLVNQLSTMP